jgi:hypothetical protein
MRFPVMEPTVCQLKPVPCHAVPRIDETHVAQGNILCHLWPFVCSSWNENMRFWKRDTYAQGHDKYHITGDLHYGPLLGSAVETVPAVNRSNYWQKYS